MFTCKIGFVVSSKELLDSVQAALNQLPARVVLDVSAIDSPAAFLEKLEHAQPDLMMLEYKQVENSLAESIKLIKSVSSAPKIVVLNTSADPETILRSIRSGADEYLHPPFEKDLRAAVERLAMDRIKLRAGTRPRGKVLGVLSVKGGCGATTVACQLAQELHAVTKMEVLLADFDFESGIIGFLTKAHSRYNLMDAADNILRLDMSFWKAIVSNGIPGVEVVSAPAAGSPRVYRDPEDYRNLVRFMRANYDWTVADLGRGLNYISMAVLEEVDELYLISSQDVSTLHQTKQLIGWIRERGYPDHRQHVVMNRMPKRSEITLEDIDLMLGITVYATIPSDYGALYDAMAAGTLVPGSSKLGENYVRLASKISGNDRQAPKRGFRFFL
jgi:pilus assembly protein CpaE